jgi:hypothetical protein
VFGASSKLESVNQSRAISVTINLTINMGIAGPVSLGRRPSELLVSQLIPSSTHRCAKHHLPQIQSHASRDPHSDFPYLRSGPTSIADRRVIHSPNSSGIQSISGTARAPFCSNNFRVTPLVPSCSGPAIFYSTANLHLVHLTAGILFVGRCTTSLCSLKI